MPTHERSQKRLFSRYKTEWEITLYQQTGVISSYLGELALSLARSVAWKGSYSGFPASEKEEMEDVAVLAILEALPKFSIWRDTSPHSYLRTVAIRSISNYLRKEHALCRKHERFREHQKSLGRRAIRKVDI